VVKATAASMRRHLADLVVRHEPPVDAGANLKAGLAAIFGLAVVGWTASATGLPLIAAPLGATVVLLFGQPSSPLSQPVNVMGGYFIGTVACEAAFLLYPHHWMPVAVALGVAIVVMRWLRVTHPPAGAMPIFGLAGQTHGLELFAVILANSVFLIALAYLVHHTPPRRRYPLSEDPATPPARLGAQSPGVAVKRTTGG
jgi:CBS-domain-containing membrane protein